MKFNWRSPKVPLTLGLLIVGTLFYAMYYTGRQNAQFEYEKETYYGWFVDQLTTNKKLVRVIRRQQEITMWANRYDIRPALSEAIITTARDHDIPLDVAFSLIKTESNFQRGAVSHKGAVGLAQVLPSTAQLLRPNIEVRELYKVKPNLNVGFSYLKQLYDAFGNWRHAVIAYHRGPERTSFELANNRRHGTSEAYADKVLHAR